MVSSGLGIVALVTAFASIAQGQSTWLANQVNTTLCQWQQLRVAVLHDTVYMDGGSMWWLPGLSDGSYGGLRNDQNPLGIIYTLNLSTPFKTNQNFTALLGTVSKGINGGAATNVAPNYIDGALLANGEEFFLYGGLPRLTAQYPEPDGDDVLLYLKYQYGPQKPAFVSGSFQSDQTDNGVTRYVTYGGAASVPSENKAFYFSGMRSPSHGPIYQPGLNDSAAAVNISNTLITLDFATQYSETWSNKTLPSSIHGRANPELVWVPVGGQGILVALGGVVYPDFMDTTGSSPNKSLSEAESPVFMSIIDIYDIAADEWYSQPTVDGPGQLTRGCAVVAPAQDRSSFNIYWYGGYDGLSAANRFSSDVWVLSLPSFTWTKVTSGTGIGRAGHKCFMPYPDQMIALVYNLSTASWLPGYDPAIYGDYSVPSAVVDKIGGSVTGAATATSPGPSGFAATGLANVFRTEYNATKIQSYYPYASVGPVNNTNPNTTPVPNPNGGGGVPAFLPPVLGVVLGLVFLTLIAVFILLWRRRKLFNANGGNSEAGTEDAGHRIISWMRGQAPTETPKALTATTSDYTPESPRTEVASVSTTPMSMAELVNTEVRHPVELPDTSRTPPVELHDTGLNHTEIINRYTHLSESPAVGAGSINASSFYSGATQQMDHASTLSQPSMNAQSDHQHDYEYLRRADSDVLGGSHSAAHRSAPVPSPSASPTPPAAGGSGRNHVLSGISNLSERDRAHLRQVSDTTVSSVNSGGGNGDRVLGNAGGLDSAMVMSPASMTSVRSPQAVSPPGSGASGDGDDYFARPQPFTQGQGSGSGNGGGAAASSPLRKSVFKESREDMTDGRQG
ncbi:hypothetical protein B0T17DRAFT_613795 [Bombardia bombarda]|uniref:Uncharacterized protein n=1 Tax=Bombardia bombarda TaxID=252184 RepID=A0AA39XNA2_9PEZI|nr:hypothetical protein B0T17DRAFT_613795 [Bombardia bombarda]